MSTLPTSQLHPPHLPTLSKTDAATLKALQDKWQWHAERMLSLQPARVQADRRTAYAAFVAEPTSENEQRLAVLADAQLTARRHALLYEAHAEVLVQVRRQAVEVVRPLLEQYQQILTTDLANRGTSGDSEGTTPRNDQPDIADIELRQALANLTLTLEHLEQMVHTPAMDHDWSPHALAGLFESEVVSSAIQAAAFQTRPAKPVAQR